MARSRRRRKPRTRNRHAEPSPLTGWESGWRELAGDIADPGRTLCLALAATSARESV